MDDDTIGESGAYQFIIVNENNTPSPNDFKLHETIFCIIEDFFKANPEILLYLCETGDGKQASRNRLFIKWFREYAQKHWKSQATLTLLARQNSPPWPQYG